MMMGHYSGTVKNDPKLAANVRKGKKDGCASHDVVML
jgi:hypothetical protein